MTGRRTALITGASHGIGAAAARAFAAAGYNVAVNYHTDTAAAEALVTQLRDMGAHAIALQADVAQEAQVAEMVEKTLTEFCQVDTLVCNAGVSCVKMLCDTTPEDWRRVFAVNVDGTYHCIRALLPHMVHRKAGRIVTVSSMWGITGGSCEAAYSAAKAAVIGLTKAMAKELGPSGIAVNCVAPGVIDTRMNGALSPEDLAALAAETPLQRIGRPEEVAQAILYLAGEHASFLTGQVLQVDGGIVM